MDFKINRILSRPREEWASYKSRLNGSSIVAGKELKVDWEVYNIKDYLFTHDTIVASVAVEDDGFTIAISGDEYSSGTWRFTRDGDALTTTISNEGMQSVMVIYVVKAVADYLDMNGSLTMGYINGLSTLDLSSDDFAMTPDEAAGTTDVRINIAGPWEMKGLDQMVIDDRSLFYGALTEESASIAANIGKVMMIANGNEDDVTILLGEYGELDDVALQSLINVVGILQPEGWEDFTANTTQLADMQADGYAVKLNVDAQAVSEIIDDAPEGYSFAVAHFGA